MAKEITNDDQPELNYGQTLGGWSKCYTCGKVIYSGVYDLSEWAYKYLGKFCCSYTCKNMAPQMKRKTLKKAPKDPYKKYVTTK